MIEPRMYIKKCFSDLVVKYGSIFGKDKKMTDKQIIIKLKPMEDLNEKIIKEKGNTECIFYADDICRNGDKTRDCVNCARVEYHSLYSLNWDNQERLQKIIKHKEQECEELKRENYELTEEVSINRALFAEIDQLKTENEDLKKQHQADKGLITSTGKQNYQLLQEYDKLKAENEQLKKAEEYDSRYNDMQAEIDCGEKIISQLKQTLTEIKEIAEKASKSEDYLLGQEFTDIVDKILQKISEVENE